MKTSATLTQIIAEWLTNLDVVGTTKQSYRIKIGLWFRYLTKQGIDPRQPSRADILLYKQTLESTNKSALTVDGYVTVVRLFYRYCDNRGYYDDIGIGIRSAVRYKGHRKGHLSADEAARLLSSIDVSTKIGKRDKLIIAIMLMLALRTCEVERINIGDFDKDNDIDVLHIQRKGRHEKMETMAVPVTVMDLFVDYIADRDISLESPLFINHDHRREGRLLRSSISQIIRARLVDIGITRSDITAHSLRHTCACMMVEAGVDLEKVRDMLGHTTTTTTRIYADAVHAQMLIKNSPALLVEKAINNHINDSC